uniref:PSP domain-containing protein n=1 Tax=Elaeophora elaphi TaxID=1147741 RepID=A0A0R3RRG0_9BILA
MTEAEVLDLSDDEIVPNLTKKELKELERRKNKNKKKKESKKKKISRMTNGEDGARNSDSGSGIDKTPTASDTDDNVEVIYVGKPLELDPSDPNYHYFSKVFESFKISEEVKKEEPIEKVEPETKKEEIPTKASISEKILQEEMSEKRREQEEAGQTQTLSKRKLRLSMQPTIAELKEVTTRPDVVEWADVTSRDPHLLVTLKAYRNTVPVPRHWNAKRKYLAGKRGFERPPFDLPDFIKRTGIMEMRETMWEKANAQSLKSKMRERARPKLGRIDIDYQKLHDAFFKWQTKPVMTQMGELYYEGKELETVMREKKPGELTDELRVALGMPVGPNAHKFPPPWLIAMQRYGPPPSYPNLKIPGLNCPIPEGCAFGYHAGGWGKPPVDEMGKPLYGDVFGLEDDLASISLPSFATPSGMTSGVLTGVETPDTIELRKGKRIEDSSTTGGETPAPALYTVLQERKIDRIAGQMMASTHVYDLSKKPPPAPASQGVDAGVEVSLNPEDLDLADQKGLEKKYEEQLRKQTRGRQDDDEDFSDMVAEHSAKQNRKRKVQEQKKSTQQQKKYKDFKF